jgi:four helix bundle protein
MRRAAVSVCTNIAEGCGPGGDAEFRRFLNVALRSACELECQLILLAQLKSLLYEREKKRMPEWPSNERNL